MHNPESVIRSPWKFETAPFHIADNLYYVGNTNVSSHLFDTGEGLLLLDTGYAQTSYLLTESIRDLGFDPHDVKWIVHTHGHIDHFGATRMFVEKYGCKTYMPAVDIPLLNERADLNWCDELGLPYSPPWDTWFQPDHGIEIGETLTFGNTKMTAYNAAGHTPGTMAYVFELPSGLRAAMHGGIGLNTMRGSYSEKFGLGNTWRNAYRDTLDRLQGLKVDIVLGNHPNQSSTFDKLARKTEDCNPFIDPTEWDRFLNGVRERFLKLVAENPIED